MSIGGAVAELNKEIERLTKIRDTLLQGASAVTAIGSEVAPASVVRTSGSRAGTTKSPIQKKSTKVAATAGKRVVSASTRKKMSDAAKARAAKKAAGAK